MVFNYYFFLDFNFGNYFLFLMKTALSIIKITAATAKIAKRGFIVFVK